MRPVSPPSAPSSSFVGLGLRLFWLALGAVTLVALAGLIAQRAGLSLLDGLYAATAVAMALARYLDIAFFHGTTGDGEPATLQHFARYTLGLAITSAVIWAAAHVIGGW